MESYAISYGSRIKYDQDGKIMTSKKIYSNGHKMVRIIIDLEVLSFRFVDPVTGMVLFQSETKWTNLEVLQRNVKKELKSKLGIRFDKELRKKLDE